MCTINFKTLIINKINQRDFIGWPEGMPTQTTFLVGPFFRLQIYEEPLADLVCVHDGMLKVDFHDGTEGIRAEERRKNVVLASALYVLDNTSPSGGGRRGRSVWWLYRNGRARCCNYSYHRERRKKVAAVKEQQTRMCLHGELSAIAQYTGLCCRVW